MKIRKAYQFRLKTTTEIENQFLQFAGACRKVWNKVLEVSLRRLGNKQPILWYYEADFWVKLWKESEEYHFLKKCPAQLLQQKLQDLNKAFQDGFDRSQPSKRLPTWRKLGKHDSFRYPQHFKLDNRRVFLPKIGWVGFFKSQSIQGKPKNVTISRKGKHWYMSVQVEQDGKPVKTVAKSAIGIDLGVTQFAALSDGKQIKGIHSFKIQAEKLAKQQRRLARKRKYSNNWRKQVKRIGMCHRKIANVRLDFLHKESTKLSHNHAMIVVEDLKITNMSKSGRGTLKNPGKKVRAKSGLNKSILDQGWGEFKRQLRYKLEWLGGVFLEVDPKYTSQQCHSCKHTSNANRISQSLFCCINCNYTENADTNAAKNILAAGHAVLACGEAA